jgi:hypothetical protein
MPMLDGEVVLSPESLCQRKAESYRSRCWRAYPVVPHAKKTVAGALRRRGVAYLLTEYKRESGINAASARRTRVSSPLHFLVSDPV